MKTKMDKRVLQRRITAEPIQVRTNSDGTIGVRGYAAVFGQVAHGETIDAGAFDRTLAQRDDIRLLVNHEGVALARTKSGTLDLGVDERGLWFDAPNLDPANPDVQRLVSAMSRGDIDQCSFAGYFVTERVQSVDHVREVRAVDVSVVTYPWYDETTATITGDRGRDLALTTRSAAAPSFTPAERFHALHVLRAAPPGKESYGDLGCALMDALEESLEESTGAPEVWVFIEDFGDDWVVYQQYDLETYEFGPYFQCSWSRDAAGAFTFGDAFEVEPITEYRPVSAADAADGQGDRAEPAAPAAFKIADARALLGF